MTLKGSAIRPMIWLLLQISTRVMAGLDPAIQAQSLPCRFGRRTLLAPDLRGKKRQRRRRHTFDTAGLAERARSDFRKPQADLVRKSGEAGIVERVGDEERFIASEGGDIGRLAIQIDGIFGIDLDLRRRRVIDAAELRPDGPQGREIDVGKAEQIEARRRSPS